MESLEERLRRAAERAERPQAPAWTPNQDVTHPRDLGGVVVDRIVKQNVGFENRQTVSVVTVREAGTEKEWSVWCFGTVLASDLAPAPIGAVVFVRYEGRRQGGRGGGGYESYRVVVDAGELTPAAVEVAPAEPELERQPVEPPPPPRPEETCEACGGTSGRHAPGCPGRPSEACATCGFLNGHHRPGCPDEIPF